MLTFRDYGVTWDEPVQHTYGRMVLRYYATLFADRSALSYANLYYYGGFFDSVAALLVRVSPLGLYETRHFLNGLVGILSVVGVFSLARLLAGPTAGLMALLVIVFSPAYYGHMYNNPKDIPFAAFYVWSMYYIVKSLRFMPAIPRSIIFKLGISIGLALSVRIGGLILVVYLFIAVAAGILTICFKSSGPSASRRCIATLIASFVASCATAFCIMYLFWPWIQQNTLARISQAVAMMSRFRFVPTAFFQGQMIPATQLPPDYLFTYILIKLPEITLVGLGAGLVLVLRMAFTRRRMTFIGATSYCLIGLSVVMPICYALYKKSVLYDEMRHFLFIVPVLSAASGVAIAAVYDICKKRRWVGQALLSVLSCYFVAQLAIMLRLHPHQYIYYNVLVGGVKGAEGEYVLDYWGNSYKEAAEKLNRYLQGRDRSDAAGKRYVVAVCGPVRSAEYYLAKNCLPVSTVRNADFYIHFNGLNCDAPGQGKDIIAIKRLGATLSVVRELR